MAGFFAERLQTRQNRFHFERSSAQLRQTPSLSDTSSSGIIVSSVVGRTTACVNPVARGSFMIFSGDVNAQATDKGNFAEEARATIAPHVPGIQINALAKHGSKVEDLRRSPVAGRLMVRQAPLVASCHATHRRKPVDGR